MEQLTRWRFTDTSEAKSMASQQGEAWTSHRMEVERPEPKPFEKWETGLSIDAAMRTIGRVENLNSLRLQ